MTAELMSVISSFPCFLASGDIMSGFFTQVASHRRSIACSKCSNLLNFRHIFDSEPTKAGGKLSEIFTVAVTSLPTETVSH